MWAWGLTGTLILNNLSEESFSRTQQTSTGKGRVLGITSELVDPALPPDKTEFQLTRYVCS